MAGKKKGGEGNAASAAKKAEPVVAKEAAAPSKQAAAPAAKKAAAPKEAKEAAPVKEVQQLAQEKEVPKEAIVAPKVEGVPSQAVVPNGSATGAPKVEKKPKTEQKEIKRETGKGIVKAVLSGDTLVVINLTKAVKGPPEEKVITLSLLHAPAMARRKQEGKPSEPEQPWAWESREFLRKLVIGKAVAFTIENKAPKGNKEYGVIWLDTENGRENIAKIIAREGWAEVRQPRSGGDVWPEWDDLLKAQEHAQREELGMFDKSEKKEAHVRRVKEITNPSEHFDKLKRTAQTGIVEQVRTGSLMKVLLVPDFIEITLLLSGVECPMTRQNESEPFGREAKFFTEHKILNREVQIMIEGADKNNFHGTVSYQGFNISEELLKEGLARYVDWTGSRTTFTKRLKAAQRQAQEAKTRLWKDYEHPKVASKEEDKKAVRTGREIKGQIIDVVSGGCVIILDGKKESQVYLSSIKPPRQGNPHAKPEQESKKDQIERSLAFEAKEFLRKRLIGQKVRCVVDYTRSVPITKNGKEVEDERIYCSIYLNKNNVAVELVEQGLATTQEHRGGEQRSKDYEDILFAEARSKKAGKGRHASEEKFGLTHIVDTTRDIKEAQKKAPFFLRGGRMRGVVEHEFGASRLKLLVPKESCQITFLLEGLQTPAKKDQPELFEEAKQFTKVLCHQHDVDFEITSTDKTGSFVGKLWIGKDNLATLLLQEGFAKTFRGTGESEFVLAEDLAKKMKKNIWANWDEAAEKEKARLRRAEKDERQKPTKEYLNVIITEIIDGSKFYVQIISKEAEELESLMEKLSKEDSGVPYTPKVYELVKAKFTQDETWYRAKVVSRKDDDYTVQYIDYGNSEVITSSRMRPLAAEFQKLQPQAVECQLAYVKAPGLTEDYGVEAAEFFKDLVWDKTMMAKVEYREGDTTFVSLGDKESEVHVNAALLRAGLARVQSRPRDKARSLIDKLKEDESLARSARVCMWQYGDPGSDDEDDDKRRGRFGGSKR